MGTIVLISTGFFIHSYGPLYTWAQYTPTVTQLLMRQMKEGIKEDAFK